MMGREWVTGTQYVYPRRDGQVELTWVAGYILFTNSNMPREFMN